MIARRKLITKQRDWNKKWGAPQGHKQYYGYVQYLQSPVYPWINKICSFLGMSDGFPDYFDTQENSTTRAFEYPWVYFATKLVPKMTVIEIGGGFSGFQFVLGKIGLNVLNIDPGDPLHKWTYTSNKFKSLNKSYGTQVKLIPNSFKNANIESGSIDRIFCISVLEHLSDSERLEIAKESYRALKPGGFLVATVDLFFDIYPFTEVKTNIWGSNMNISSFVNESRLKLVQGETSELFGYKDFNVKNIMSKSGEYLFNAYYPVVTQAFVLQKA